MFNKSLSLVDKFRNNSSESKAVARLTGIIKTYVKDRGFGFINVKDELNKQETYFFHFSNFPESEHDKITEGATVEFTPDIGRQGPRALRIQLKDTPVVEESNTPELPAPAETLADNTDFVKLRVRSITPAKALAGSIVAHVMKGDTVILAAIGHGAVAQAVKAVPIASGRTAPNGFMLAILPSFDVQEIDPPADAPPLPEGGVMERTLTMMHLVKVRPY